MWCTGATPTTRPVIDAALRFLADEINGHLLKRTGSVLGQVEPGMLVDDKGHWVVPQDALRLTLFQVEEERTMREQLPERITLGARDLHLPPALKLNLVCVLAGRFQQYAQAWRHLSLVMGFLHARPVFTPEESPGMPAGLGRLSLELANWTPEQMNQLWGTLGAKHLPSVIYRLRVVILQDSEPAVAGAPITTIHATLGGR